jgi:hypothetical protein
MAKTQLTVCLEHKKRTDAGKQKLGSAYLQGGQVRTLRDGEVCQLCRRDPLDGTPKSQPGGSCVCGHIWEVHWDGEQPRTPKSRSGCYHCARDDSGETCEVFRQRCGYHSRAWGCRCDLAEGHDGNCDSAGDGFKGGYIPGEETWD